MTNPWVWMGFVAFVVAMLALDLLVVHRKAHEVSIREAGIWTAVWIALALAFAVGTGFVFGKPRALAFLAGYTVEKALSVDNLFVFLVMFSTFRVPKMHRHKVLFWGVFGALALRGAFIALGTAALARFHFTFYVFGAVLVVVGARMLVPEKAESKEPKKAKAVARWTRGHLPTTKEYRDGAFFVRERGRLLATPLVGVLVAVELTDLVFAVDSVPAVLGVARDPFIVFTSNAFAILGLRSLFFVLAGMMEKFDQLKMGLSVVLVFIGVKMIFEDRWHVSIVQSLVFIAFVLGASVVGSLASSWVSHRSSPKSRTLAP